MTPTAKDLLRKEIRTRKLAFSSKERAVSSSLLCSLLAHHPRVKAAKVVMLYNALPDEVDTRRLIDVLRDEGKTVLLPVVLDGQHMEVRPYKGADAMHSGAFHIREPEGEAFTQLRHIDVAIVPGMAFDPAGHRLGRGRGYYDRFLPHIPQAYKIGVCFNFQLVDQVPVDTTDVKMDEVVAR